MGKSPSVGKDQLIGATGTDVHVAGGSQGSVVLFTPFNTETESARTIFDPITAIAPAWDCQTYAIGSVHVAQLLAGQY